MTDRDTDLRVEKVRKWLDGGCSSWGVPAQEIRALIGNETKTTRSDADRFWLILHEPGRVPERKGPFSGEMAKVLREFVTARPTAYIDVLTLDSFGDPIVTHGPEILQMLDGRSMNTGRKHNQRTREAHAPYHEATRSDEALLREALDIAREALGRIASNGFGFPIRMIDHKRDKELLAAMDYARDAGKRIAALNPPGVE